MTADGNLAKAFDAKASPPPLVAAETYRLMLERLLTEGKAFGKTEPVAAYLLRDLSIVTEIMAAETGMTAAEVEQKIKVQPLYVVMDIAQWPNEYGRSLVMQDIAVQYAKRVVGENDLNGPDFKGPGLWTSKQSNVEQDYTRREELNEYGRPSNVWDPNPDAFRLTLKFNNAATLPMAWGSYTILAGGTLAIRDKDIPALAEALQSIRDGKATAEEALFTMNTEGKFVSRFDAYGMEPGFLEKNYKPVELKEETRTALDAFRTPPAKKSPGLNRGGKV